MDSEQATSFDDHSSKWVQDLLEELPTRFHTEAADLTLPEIVREITTWAESAPHDAWKRTDNIRSLIADTAWAVGAAGDKLQAETTTLRDTFDDALHEAVKARSDARQQPVLGIAQAGRSLLDGLSRSSMRGRAWDDLVTAAKGEAAAPRRIRDRVALLQALLETAGIDPAAVFGELRSNLDPQDYGVKIDGPSVVPEAERLDLCRQAVKRPPTPGECVVWLAYDDARLERNSQTVGPITFYEADWAVPNALTNPGHPFTGRDELEIVLVDWIDIRNLDRDSARHYQVLARVDLGRRTSHRAIEDASAMVDITLGIVANRTGAPVWVSNGSACLVVNGVVARTRWSLARTHADTSFEPDHYGQNGTAAAMAENADELGKLFSLGYVPADLSEAMRLIGEAAQVDSREDQLYGVATIAEQTVVVLQASAVERIGSLAKMNLRDLDGCLLAQWPMAHWRSEVAEVISRCLNRRDGMDPLFQAVCLSQHGHWSFTAAFEHRDELAASVTSRPYRNHAAAVLSSIGDADSCVARLTALEEDAERVNDRLRRVRNALMHGNPVTSPSVNSVRSLARFKADVALDEAIQSVVRNEPAQGLFFARQRRRQVERANLAAGMSMYDQWLSNTE